VAPDLASGLGLLAGIQDFRGCFYDGQRHYTIGQAAHLSLEGGLGGVDIYFAPDLARDGFDEMKAYQYERRRTSGPSSAPSRGVRKRPGRSSSSTGPSRPSKSAAAG
jgi:hypothetical protein